LEKLSGKFFKTSLTAWVGTAKTTTSENWITSVKSFVALTRLEIFKETSAGYIPLFISSTFWGLLSKTNTLCFFEKIWARAEPHAPPPIIPIRIKNNNRFSERVKIFGFITVSGYRENGNKNRRCRFLRSS
jgi:hypothetical protein